MLVVDENGRLTRANRAASGWTADTPSILTGTRLESLSESPVWRVAAERVRIARELGTSSPSRVNDATSGNATRTWEIWATRFVPIEGAAPHCIVVARELTALLALQDELQRQETMARMGELVAGVAHEVRNALFGLSSAVDAMRARAGNSPELARYSPVLASQVQRLADLTRDLLEYGKPMSLSVAPCSIDDLVREGVAATISMAKASGVTVVQNENRDDGLMMVDRSRILQVLQNLVLNAVQHSPRGAVVEVGASRVVQGARVMWRVDVADHGPGFEADALQHAFEPFFTRRSGGTGLGLAIAHRIVHDHGGTISAANRSGGGAVVAFQIEGA